MQQGTVWWRGEPGALWVMFALPRLSQYRARVPKNESGLCSIWYSATGVANDSHNNSVKNDHAILRSIRQLKIALGIVSAYMAAVHTNAKIGLFLRK